MGYALFPSGPGLLEKWFVVILDSVGNCVQTLPSSSDTLVQARKYAEAYVQLFG